MIAIDGPLPPRCPNCAAPVHGPYCAQCGQETVIGVPTLRQFGHEYVQTFVSLEGRLWRSLWLLIRWPGQLTVEFLAGRRRRYVRPMPLYLSLSFLFFLVLNLSVGDQPFGGDQADAPATRAVQVDTEERSELGKLGLKLSAPKWMQPLVQRYVRSAERFEQDPKQASRQLTAAFLGKLPYAMFVLVPAFALATRWVYRRRRRSYTEHLLFALHLHAFVFLYLTIVQLMPGGPMSGFMLPIWWIYLSASLRRVFAGRWLPQVLRGLTLMVGHFLLLTCTMLVVLLLSLPSVS